MAEIMAEIQAREIAWYRRFGRYPERIKNGVMIGDWWWNLNHPDKTEIVEPLIQAGAKPPNICPHCGQEVRG